MATLGEASIKRRPGFGAAENEKLRWGHVQANFFGFAAVIDATKNGDTVREETCLQALDGFHDGIRAAQVD